MIIRASESVPEVEVGACATQALELQKISHRLFAIVREFQLSWPERILRPVQWAKGLVTAWPWIVNTVELGRDLGALHDWAASTCGAEPNNVFQYLDASSNHYLVRENRVVLVKEHGMLLQHRRRSLVLRRPQFLAD